MREIIYSRMLYYKMTIGICIFITIIYTFFMNQIDCETITRWGYDLLRCLSDGNLSGFPAYTYNSGNLATNYSLLFNTLTSIWLAPLYVIFGVSDIGLYELWYKVFVLLTTIITCQVIWLILKAKKVDKEKQYEAIILYLSGTFLNTMILLQGQCDGFAVLLMLMGILFLIDNRLYLAPLMFGLSFMIKPFVLFCIVPLVILYMPRIKNYIRMVLFGIILVAPFVVDRIITKLIMPEYYVYSKITDETMSFYMGGKNFYNMFFYQESNGFLLFFGFFLLLSIILLFVANHWDISDRLYCIGAILPYVFMCIFVFYPTYHLVIISPFVIYLVVNSRVRKMSFLLNLGLNLGAVINLYFIMDSFIANWSASFFFSDASLQIYEKVLPKFSEYREILGNVGITIVVVCMIALVLLAAYDVFTKKIQEKEAISGVIRKVMIALQLVPVLIHLGSSCIELLIVV